MKDTTEYTLEDIIWKQLMNIEKANELLKKPSIKKSPNINKILNNYNKSVEMVFCNLSRTRKINVN